MTTGADMDQVAGFVADARRGTPEEVGKAVRHLEVLSNRGQRIPDASNATLVETIRQLKALVRSW